MGDVLRPGHLLPGDRLEEGDDRPPRHEAVEGAHASSRGHAATLAARGRARRRRRGPDGRPAAAGRGRVPDKNCFLGYEIFKKLDWNLNILQILCYETTFIITSAIGIFQACSINNC